MSPSARNIIHLLATCTVSTCCIEPISSPITIIHYATCRSINIVTSIWIWIIIQSTSGIPWMHCLPVLLLNARALKNFKGTVLWRKNVVEFFLKFYLHLSALWSRSRRDGRVIQRNSKKKTNKLRIIFLNAEFYLNYSELLWIFRPLGLKIPKIQSNLEKIQRFFWIILNSFFFFFGISLNFSPSFWKHRHAQTKFQKQFRDIFPPGYTLFRSLEFNENLRVEAFSMANSWEEKTLNICRSFFYTILFGEEQKAQNLHELVLYKYFGQ